MISCPRCGDDSLRIVYRAGVLSRGALSGKGERPLPAPDGLEEFLGEHFEDVGERFADEARRMHFGEEEHRNIRGRATADEERELTEEGVPFLRLPIPKPAN